MIKAVALDIGETLVSDTRFWAGWADWLGVPRHTVSALVGAVVSRGEDHTDAIRLLRPGLDMDAANAAREASGRGDHLDETDLYPDVRPSLAALRQAGVRVVVAGNQTARTAQLLRALDLPADAVATSGEWGPAKPDPAFFAHLLEATRTPAAETLYVGDHPAEDIHPAKEAGLLTAHLRRGPWGHYWADDPLLIAAADFRVDSLTELPALIDL
ncbi:haloacid dehalogenase superfamily, subfamily IA, variant 3 with third motif having DD or ED/haloacid dehalogenase superfamily, subfamily IA, variant 1 with third motif having Dx(3-4)D or Dx(3-4)E [Actinacidiphila yanglinensis]|uniref:Haloacid dehalogenase superfamily, subfamily IA, variant 3 with third motif having DD or ED/haloacid dehalogenase superfamily, subfamily IA, variant 1 with third motif having Dx(3-4)D or Dx(3-4)E n=1 Tax=Actinacidiphila yanglinensis TaxID=310779 RepID=A0A1H6AXX9_9ACTN|nr:HAD family hydrolase [Actinacidiphila yanglinensis]SEG53503.1 haloacid dehalogenase superfamily, subfamily IA, variant 3 with third motif having DD or ED/haloacid dehalogenase superfamily, subfamily IA, variant 1 with third motif having Dx(3-4)D or Dx(3-4)E [Actinacidiphila yanglinensis]